MKELLDDAILARMITDHRQNSARLERLQERGQGARQAIQFVVHRDSHRLEQPGKVAGAGGGPQGSANGIDQVLADGK